MVNDLDGHFWVHTWIAFEDVSAVILSVAVCLFFGQVTFSSPLHRTHFIMGGSVATPNNLSINKCPLKSDGDKTIYFKYDGAT